MTTWHLFRKSSMSTKRVDMFPWKPNIVILICVKGFVTGIKKNYQYFIVAMISMGLLTKVHTARFISAIIRIPWLTIFSASVYHKIPWMWNGVGYKYILFFSLSLWDQLSSIRPYWWNRQGNVHFGNTSKRPHSFWFWLGFEFLISCGVGSAFEKFYHTCHMAQKPSQTWKAEERGLKCYLSPQGGFRCQKLLKNLSIKLFLRQAGICRWPVSSVDKDIISLNNWNLKADNFVPETQSRECN